MAAWTRLVRFEDQSGKIRLGQPVDASQDVGLACAAGEPVEVKLISGDIFTGTLTEQTATIKKVSSLVLVLAHQSPMLTAPFLTRSRPPHSYWHLSLASSAV